jgi:hypothetical protein
MARDYLEVYRRMVHDGLERIAPMMPAVEALTLPTGGNNRQRKFSRSHAPLLGVVPGGQRGGTREQATPLLHS